MGDDFHGSLGIAQPVFTIFCRSLAYALVVPAMISLIVSLYEQVGQPIALGVHIGTLCSVVSVLDIRILKWYRRIEWARLYHSCWQNHSAHVLERGYLRTAWRVLREILPMSRERAKGDERP